MKVLKYIYIYIVYFASFCVWPCFVSLFLGSLTKDKIKQEKIVFHSGGQWSSVYMSVIQGSSQFISFQFRSVQSNLDQISDTQYDSVWICSVQINSIQCDRNRSSTISVYFSLKLFSWIQSRLVQYNMNQFGPDQICLDQISAEVQISLGSFSPGQSGAVQITSVKFSNHRTGPKAGFMCWQDIKKRPSTNLKTDWIKPPELKLAV